MSRTVSHHVSKRCAERRISLADLVKLEVYDQVVSMMMMVVKYRQIHSMASPTMALTLAKIFWVKKEVSPR